MSKNLIVFLILSITFLIPTSVMASYHSVTIQDGLNQGREGIEVTFRIKINDVWEEFQRFTNASGTAFVDEEEDGDAEEWWYETDQAEYAGPDWCLDMWVEYPKVSCLLDTEVGGWR